MASITSTNAVIILSAPLLGLTAPMQGFSADDIFNADDIDISEDYMGLDGKLSAGFVPVAVPWSITLQADSLSNGFFEFLYNSEQLAREKFFLQGNVTLPSLPANYTMTNGILKSYSPMASGKKALQPRKFTIKWESVLGFSI